MNKWLVLLAFSMMTQITFAQRADFDIDSLTVRATAGDLEAQKQLATHYQSGGQSLNDMRQAARWLREAANQGDADAQTQWAYFLTSGRGDVEKNPQAAVTWLARAAAQGHQPAQIRLGWHYRNGIGIKRNHQQAAHWYVLGIKASKWEWPSESYYLGGLYRSGTGVKRNLSAARSWFERAAKSAHPPSLYQLGLMHQYGEGVTADPAKAAEYFLATLDGGYDISGRDSNILVDGGSIESAARTSLAYLYWQGLGIQEDKARAAELYRDAATYGNYVAQHNLGLSYFHGIGVALDRQTALEWLTRSANQRYQPAQISLGHFYNNGIAVPRDVDKALEWYRKAAKQGNEEGARQVALITKERQPEAPAQTVRRKPPESKPRSTPSYSASDEITAGDVVGGLAVIAGLIWLADAVTDNGSDTTGSSGNTRPMEQYVAQCRQDVYRRIYRCYTHGSVCDLTGCVYEWNCQTKQGGRGECRRYRGYSDDIEDVFCDPKVGKGFRTEEEVMAHSCR